MELSSTTVYKTVIGLVLFFFWLYTSESLTMNSSLTLAVIPISLGMLTAVGVIIQLFLKESMQTKMKDLLDSEIEKRKEELNEKLTDLAIYLSEERIPKYSESGVEGLEDSFHEFDSIKSKYTFQGRVISATIFIILSALILVLFWANPTLWIYPIYYTSNSMQQHYDLTVAHVGLGFLTVALWWILNILVVSLEVKIWEREEKPKRHKKKEKSSSNT
jgi:hypothetical protein